MMDSYSVEEKQYLVEISNQLSEIANDLNILTRLAWPESVKEEFFNSGCQRLPLVEYEAYSSDEKLRALEECRNLLNGSRFDPWIIDNIESVENSVRMLACLGTESFSYYSRKVYGYPMQKLRDEKSTSFALASQMLQLIQPMEGLFLGEPPPACVLASTVAEKMQEAVKKFGDKAPEIVIVDSLSANALAGSERVRIRRNACFTDNDVLQLVEHEINIHVATLLNGKHPDNLGILGSVLPRTTKTQEGLAVFAEFITGNMDIDRFARLAHRVIAIQMALDDATFIDVYRYFLEHTDNPEQSFENARRVFRGGVVSGGAPFTKDIVYLDGLLRVHNFLRAAVMNKKSQFIPLLFSGRMCLDDIVVVNKLKQIGLCAEPMYLPDWAGDLRFLLSYLSYSSFLNSVDMTNVNEHYGALLSELV
ncbi:flavohemoglobin expression-modulating QEGLA motif protein [Aliikangiella sp. G2MR2-5]|uniref:flavohemoglobin expression-modulating QEGLA motif protein n=1 Tax=Aliikangiella sp. G2MR2-5 TaxID=2788943 RepID=UPI0018AAB5A0|nr:flavohemoglobin expression-modulating QEGLA motif protein [Aliikangiella sp. G2MR2-5]